MHYEPPSVLVARSSRSLNFESKTPFHGWRERHQKGGDERAAPQRQEIKNWTREVYQGTLPWQPNNIAKIYQRRLIPPAFDALENPPSCYSCLFFLICQSSLLLI